MKIVLTSVGSEEQAERIAGVLLREKLAACIQIIPVGSMYWWNGRIEKNNREFQLLVKTRDSLADAVLKRVKVLHDYELPVIEVIDVEQVNPEADEWINKVT